MIYDIDSVKTRGVDRLFKDIVFSFLDYNNISFNDHLLDSNLFNRDILEYNIDVYKCGVSTVVKVIFNTGTEYIEEIGYRVCTLNISINDNKYIGLNETHLKTLYRINKGVYTDNKEDIILNAKTHSDRFIKDNINNTYITNINTNKMSHCLINYLSSKVETSMRLLGRSLDFSIKDIYFRHSIQYGSRTLVVVIKNSDNLGTEAISFM